jgi:glycosyltransferase involved in cell wall biosynthesis
MSGSAGVQFNRADDASRSAALSEPTRRLWVFNHYALPGDRGALTRHYDLARDFDGNIETWIFAAGFNHYTQREERLGPCALYRLERFGRVTFVWLRTTPYRGNGMARALNMLSYFLVVLVVQSRFRAPSMVLGSSVHPLAALAAVVVARSRRRAFAFEVRDLWPQALIDLRVISSTGVAARSMRLLERFLCRSASVVISVLPHAAPYLEACGAKRVVVVPNSARIPNGHALSPLSSPGQRAVETIRLHHDAGDTVFVYAGSHGEQNDLGNVLSAADILKSCDVKAQFVLIGDGAEKPNLLRWAAAHRLTNVTFADPVLKDEVNRVLSHADVGVVSLADLNVYRFGLSPNKLFDYYAAGLPVLLAARYGQELTVRPGAGWLVDPGDPARFADMVVRITAMGRDARRRVGQTGLKLVESEYNTTTMASRLAAALGLMGSPGG